MTLLRGRTLKSHVNMETGRDEILLRSTGNQILGFATIFPFDLPLVDDTDSSTQRLGNPGGLSEGFLQLLNTYSTW